MRFWFVVAILESRTCAKNMGHAERDQQIAKRTIYSSKTKWAKSKGEPESLFPSPSILFSRETKRNETKLIPSMTGRKPSASSFHAVLPLDTPHSSLPFLFLYFSFFFYFSTAPLLPRRARFLAHKARILDSRKKKKGRKGKKKRGEREKSRQGRDIGSSIGDKGGVFKKRDGRINGPVR